MHHPIHAVPIPPGAFVGEFFHIFRPGGRALAIRAVSCSSNRGRPGFLGIRYIRVFNIRYTVFLCRKWCIKYYTFLNFGIKYTLEPKLKLTTPVLMNKQRVFGS